MNEMRNIIKTELSEAASVLDRFLNDEKTFQVIEEAAKVLVKSFEEGGKVLACGNGGSHCEAMHFAEELTGRFRDERPAIPAIAIADPSHITCVSNDYGFEAIFSRYVEALGNKGDILLAISTSGNSVNVINAAKVAQHKGMKVIGLTGKTGGELAALSDVEIRTPMSTYADRVQEIHIKVIHILILLIEQNLKK